MGSRGYGCGGDRRAVCDKIGREKYRVKDLTNQEEVLGAISDMLSRKSSGTLKMPAAYGAKSVFGKLLRKKAALICAAGAVVVMIAAAVLTPVIMKLSASEVTDAAYEWTVKEIYSGGLNTAPRVNERTITGCYSGGWLNGKPYGTRHQHLFFIRQKYGKQNIGVKGSLEHHSLFA